MVMQLYTGILIKIYGSFNKLNILSVNLFIDQIMV